MKIIKIFILIATGLFLNNCANKSHSDAVLGGATGATMCLEYIEDNPYLIAMCAVGTGFVADGSWIEKPSGLKPDYVIEGNKRMNIFERNAYIEKYYPNN